MGFCKHFDCSKTLFKLLFARLLLIFPNYNSADVGVIYYDRVSTQRGKDREWVPFVEVFLRERNPYLRKDIQDSKKIMINTKRLGRRA